MKSLLEDPPQVDSEDLTSEEVASAVVTANAKDLASRITSQLNGPVQILSHDLRRKDGHLYCRMCLGDGNSLVFQIDWVKP